MSVPGEHESVDVPCIFGTQKTFKIQRVNFIFEENKALFWAGKTASNFEVTPQVTEHWITKWRLDFSCATYHAIVGVAGRMARYLKALVDEIGQIRYGELVCPPIVWAFTAMENLKSMARPFSAQPRLQADPSSVVKQNTNSWPHQGPESLAPHSLVCIPMRKEKDKNSLNPHAAICEIFNVAPDIL